MNSLAKRFFEYFMVEIALSVLATCLLTGILKRVTGFMAVAMMLLCGFIHALYMFRVLFIQRKFTQKKRYYKMNLIVFFSFFAVNITMAILNLEPVYTFLFLPYKVFAILGINKVVSAIIVNLFMLIMIAVIPWVVKPNRRRVKKESK